MFFLIFIGMSEGALSETGWLRFVKKNDIYYRPFVDVINPKNKLVVFVTEDGHIYKGRCRKKRVAKTCRVTPSKRFSDKFVEIRYIVLELVPDYPPKLVRSGVVERLNVVNQR
ncbi:hypothetical protein [Phorcysia thermohydrogeniphila]|uniref:hypothetical protein n=1 Tax=Phorcysia thermohydrogeniphila TaxID=936138 RepID=UPI0014023666|nr:hypothetical protein [Phorcysia thermohydrogeniphila]